MQGFRGPHDFLLPEGPMGCIYIYVCANGHKNIYIERSNFFVGALKFKFILCQSANRLE